MSSSDFSMSQGSDKIHFEVFVGISAYFSVWNRTPCAFLPQIGGNLVNTRQGVICHRLNFVTA